MDLAELINEYQIMCQMGEMALAATTEVSNPSCRSSGHAPPRGSRGITVAAVGTDAVAAHVKTGCLVEQRNEQGSSKA